MHRLMGAVALLAAAVVACGAPAATQSSSPAATTPGAATASSAPTATPLAPVDSGPALAVLGTENFYADLLAQIGGARVKASSILNDPAVDPHEYEASAQAAAAVADAKIVILNGVGYDDFMQKLLSAANKPDRIVINVQKELGLAGDVNAHIWYDTKTMKKVAESATAALTKLDPKNAAYFSAKKDAYIASLKAIDDKIAALKVKYEATPVAFTEPVAEYQADAIGLKVLTPEGFMKAIEQGIDPKPADLADERDLITRKKVKVLFYNVQVTSPVTKDIYDLAVKTGVPVVGVAETIPPQYKTYQEWQLAQLNDLEKALAKG